MVHFEAMSEEQLPSLVVAETAKASLGMTQNTPNNRSQRVQVYSLTYLSCD